MVRIYDRTADDAFRAQDYIKAAWEEGDFREVKQYVDTLYNAASEFETLASEWEEIAIQYENWLMEEGEL